MYYEYVCEIHKEFEAEQSIKDPPLNECPQCVKQGIKNYLCKQCDTTWRINCDVQMQPQENINKCINCGSLDLEISSPKPKKLISLSSFTLKGGGWASEGYK